ncbi:SDR family oxidoreductase [Parasalinivibrio latis]|uniref:SDR family oxidoreductase n=1 Tax=Parasalinivibrio latis TaxID=2952610 RepID=UPI0030E3D0CA
MEQGHSSKPLVMITGASSGMGEASAKLFSAAGHPLLLIARRKERMDALNLPDSLCVKADVRDREALLAAVKEAEARFGPVDCLLNNAGIARLGNVIEQNPAEWDETIDINAKGVMNAIHAVLPGMVKRQGGTIINMSSIAGRKTYPDHCVYTGTKFFVHAISETIRAQVALSNIRVIVISPGVIETEVLDHVTDQKTLADYRANKVRIGGGIPAESVANMMLFAYQQPQNVLIQEICVTPTRQDY